MNLFTLSEQNRITLRACLCTCYLKGQPDYINSSKTELFQPSVAVKKLTLFVSHVSRPFLLQHNTYPTLKGPLVQHIFDACAQLHVLYYVCLRLTDLEDAYYYRITFFQWLQIIPNMIIQYNCHKCINVCTIICKSMNFIYIYLYFVEFPPSFFSTLHFPF